MDGVSPIDVIVAAVVGVAVLRGVFRGLIREAFSVGALAAACVAVRMFNPSLSIWLEEVSGGQLGSMAAPWAGGALIATAAVLSVVLIGRVLRKSARWAGLGWADRAGGAVLGAAEGALVVGIVLVLASAFLGRAHPALAGTRSLAALEELERLADDREIDVAAPPPRTL
jgi:membrane protein required for colicin V production